MTDLLPAAHTWIDELAKVFQIEDKRGSQIRSYEMSELNDFPTIMTSGNTPCVVHYITDCQPLYSTSGPVKLMWVGQSDFHITPDVKPANYGPIMEFYPLILAAAMSNIKLNNKVAHFVIPNEPGVMRFVTFRDPVTGKETHQGIVVRWQVSQDVSGYTVSA